MFLSNLKKSLINPTEFYQDLNRKEDSPLAALGIFLLSSGVLLLTILAGAWIFGSDLIGQFFHYQLSTFVVQQYTSAQILGYYIPSNQVFLLFLDDWFALVKIMLCVVGLLWVFGRLFREKIPLTKIFAAVTWSSVVLLPLAGATCLFWGLRFVIPLYYNYVYFVIFFGVLVVFLLTSIVVGLGKVSTTSIYKRVLMLAGVILVLSSLWTLNHADLLLTHTL
jgi:hypothetical protein